MSKIHAASLILMAACGFAVAQPTLLVTGFGASTLSRDGRTLYGGVYDSEFDTYRMVRSEYGVSTTFIPVADYGNIYGLSADQSVIGYEGYNFENLNNAANTITYGFDGQWNQTRLACTWTAEGRSNLGVAPTGSRCDYTINTPYDLSGDGRFIGGGMWTNGLCGAYRAYVQDRTTRQFTLLPISFEPPPASSFATATRVNAINFNGTVAAGYDLNYPPAGGGRIRRPAVWRKTGNTWSQTILDRSGGEAYVISDDGNIVAGKNRDNELTRWIFVNGAWTEEVIAGGTGLIPGVMSGDGSTMAGDIFIWGANINEGVPIGILDHVASLGGFFPNFTIGNPLGASVHAISDDGQKILVSGINSTSECLSTFLTAVISLNGGNCVAPSIVIDPSTDTQVDPRPGYYSFGVILNCFAQGSWPVQYRWQKLESGTWTDLIEDPLCTLTYDSNLFDVKAVNTSQLRLGFLSGTYRGRYRCVVTNDCGTVTTGVARITNCPADYNTDGGVDADDVILYFADWDAGSDEADFDNNGGVDSDDVIGFFSRWDAGC